MLECATDLLRRVRAACRAMSTALVERPHYEKFARFYEGLAKKRKPFYLFVSRGLLHWARKAVEFVPAHVNLVVIGASLTSAELDWLRRNVRRLIDHIALAVDDKTVWDFLFRVNQYDFGWIDSDCLVPRCAGAVG